MSEAGIPCGSIQTIGEICESETLKQRGMIWKMDHPSAGELRNIANPIEMTGTPFPAPSPPPLLGEHTATVLEEVLGHDAEKIAALKLKGAI